MVTFLAARKLRSTNRVYERGLELPSGYEPFAVLPFGALALGGGSEDAWVLGSRNVDWGDVDRSLREHEALDNILFERLDERFERGKRLSSSWVADRLHPPHVRGFRLKLADQRLAARGVDAGLYELATSAVQDVTQDDLHALQDDGEVDAGLLERLETDHWASKLGGAPSFRQATVRATSRSHSAPLPFVAQLGGDVLYDAFGYTYFIFGDPATGDFAVTYQR